MPHLQLAFVNERMLAIDEIKLEGLRNFYRNRPPKIDDWRSILYQAADIIDHLGWCRVALEYDTRHCAVGAIIAAYSQGNPERQGGIDHIFRRVTMVQEIVEKVENCLRRTPGADGECLMSWNDGVAKSGRQVATLLRRTAALK